MIRLLALTLIVWLSGCSLDPIFSPVMAPQPQLYPAVPPRPQPPAPLPPKSQSSPLPAPQPQATLQTPSPAVIALMQQAESDRRRGDLERAASRLERALRIQPGNAQLWYELAQIRLQQEQPGLAEELAKKSINLAGGNHDLLRRNWLLIAESRRRRGDSVGVREAERRAAGY